VYKALLAEYGESFVNDETKKPNPVLIFKNKLQRKYRALFSRSLNIQITAQGTLKYQLHQPLLTDS
jgi:hypothetical protein